MSTLPKLSKDDDVVRAAWLLEWARDRGYRIGPNLQVGGVIMNVVDLRQMKDANIAQTEPEPSVEEYFGIDPDAIPAEGTSG